MPPPARCTIQASRMRARTISTSHAKNSTAPGTARPATVLAMAASYPSASRLTANLTALAAPAASSSAQNVQIRAVRPARADGRNMRQAVTRAAATAGRQRLVISSGAETEPVRRGSFSDPPGRAAARRTGRRTAPACRAAGNHMPVRCVAVVRGGGGVCLVSGGQDNVRMPGRAVERGHVGCPAGEAGALVDVALVGYLARIQLRGVAEQHQPLDPP
jgi:hypothetical protein